VYMLIIAFLARMRKYKDSTLGKDSVGIGGGL